ncbi:hypothetical protein [Flavobacterium sp.]|uniref:hypothetical protein n=1 Tax=Flavobacterium sp. TaxID=239 RepID=UPI0025C18C25|nr:hypothetical protein [Flavobacterium sp.]MBA4154142.1 hypothetical protein [Flavobacterium sp.]
MFSTNLPTETLYKTSFTLGIIILVFTISYRLKLSFDLENLKLELRKELFVFDSKNEKNYEEWYKSDSKIKIIKSTLLVYDSLLDSKKVDKKTIETIYKHGPLKIDSLKIYNFKIDSLKKELIKDGVLSHFKEKKYMLEYEKYESFVEKQSIILFLISTLMILLGLIYWRKVQIISDNTAKINLEKLQLELEMLKQRKQN